MLRVLKAHMQNHLKILRNYMVKKEESCTRIYNKSIKKVRRPHFDLNKTIYNHL